MAASRAVLVSHWAWLALFTAAGAQARELKIGGGAAPLNNILKRVSAAFEKKTGNKLVLSEEGPDLALIHLDEGRLEAATAGVPYDQWLKLVESKGASLSHRSEIKHRTIGRDLIQVYASPDIPLASLNREQLASIFSGRLTNWKELSGFDAPIRIVMGSKVPGTNVTFQKQIMQGAKFAPNAIWVQTSPDVIQAIARSPGSIGFGPIGIELHGSNVKELGSPEVGRPILLATRGAPSPEMAELLDFIDSPEGRALIKR